MALNAKIAFGYSGFDKRKWFTSCEKEEFNVAPVELEPASATVAITVYEFG